MATLSAGILLYRDASAGLRVLLGHPGGPFFRNKDQGAWSIPKGLVEPGEAADRAARREFEEELGWPPRGPLQPLGEVVLRSGKRLCAFALRSQEAEEALLARFQPGAFTMEWPPKSGRRAAFPEIDRIAFFSIDEARWKMNPAQAALLDRLNGLPAD
ncbi:MAG: NUDIX domain-containing protein [Pirellulales bacterium]|nr:NUDIX domain-containing protein [Pirellulales bacterium]